MNFIDKLVGFVSPESGLKRVQARNALDKINRRFEGAQEGRRHQSWAMNKNPSVNELIAKDIKKLVARSRDLYINNPYARRAPGKMANNVVGSGIIPTAMLRPHLDVGGKLLPVPANGETLLETVNTIWQLWAESTTCDYDGLHNFYGLQHLIMRTIMHSGGVLVIRKAVKSDVNPLGLQLQVLEEDFIDTTKTEEQRGKYVTNGVVYEAATHKKIGYYIFDRHPASGDAKSNFVGIDEIAHIYGVERAGQNRGIPAASSTLLKQRDLDDYDDAELVGKKTAASFAGFITKDAEPESDQTDYDELEHIEPGMMHYLNRGESVTFPSVPSTQGYSDFVRVQHRAIATGYGMSYEAFTGDLTGVNFSSGRMGWLEFSREIQYWQETVLIPMLCDRVFAWFLKRLEILGFLKGIEKQVYAIWTAPRREMIDPAKEIKATRDMLRTGLGSWREEVKKMGYNPDEVLKEMAADQQKFMDAGLAPEWSPIFEYLNQKQSAAPPAPDEEDTNN